MSRALIYVRVVLLLGVVALASCAEPALPAPATAHRAFYYWRTTFALSPAERAALSELHAARLYVRAFDVVYSDETAAPAQVGPLVIRTGETVPAGVEVVPVVFVRAGLFTHLAPAQLAAAARDTWTGAVQRTAALSPAPPREIQIDCDWTESTRAAYFTFLTDLRAAAGPTVALTATIRLHQVKYRERTGVPPVDRGTLMFYNMGTFSADPDARSIFDARSAVRYLARIPTYPLPLDVALPIWSWTVHLRDGQVVGLLQSTDPDELPALPFLERAGPDRFAVTRTTYLHGTLLEQGDALKIEVTGAAEALAAAQLVAPALAPDPTRTVTLFDLSERNLTRHGPDSLARVFDAVR